MIPADRHDDASARMALAATAGDTERANRPRWLIVLGTLLLLGSLIYLGVAASGRAGAATRVRTERAKLASLQRQIAQVEAFQAERATILFPPNRNVISDLSNLATLASLDPVPTFGELQARTYDAGVTKRQYEAKLRGADAASILRWVADATGLGGVAGLQVNNLTFTPARTRPGDPVRWDADITFERWEQAQSPR